MDVAEALAVAVVVRAAAVEVTAAAAKACTRKAEVPCAEGFWQRQ